MNRIVIFIKELYRDVRGLHTGEVLIGGTILCLAAAGAAGKIATAEGTKSGTAAGIISQ